MVDVVFDRAVPQIFFVFSSPFDPEGTVELGQDMNEHIKIHGDGVKDVAFAVDDVRGIFADAIARGGVAVREPVEETDENGTITYATIRTYGDTLHSFVCRKDYKVRDGGTGARANAHVVMLYVYRGHSWGLQSA